MKLVNFEKLHLAKIMHWFQSENSILIWGGPSFKFPYTKHSFMNDLNLSETESFVLTDEQGEPLAFGQFYLRNKRCHLGDLLFPQ